MITLLDINVLIALVHTEHPHHSPATRFFPRAQPLGWATCPITENGFLRILGRPGGRLTSNAPFLARTLLHGLTAQSGHHFWPDDISLSDTGLFPSLPASKHLTDIYLLALAVKRGGRFATFDENIDGSLIPGGPQALYLIPLA